MFSEPIWSLFTMKEHHTFWNQPIELFSNLSKMTLIHFVSSTFFSNIITTLIFSIIKRHRSSINYHHVRCMISFILIVFFCVKRLMKMIMKIHRRFSWSDYGITWVIHLIITNVIKLVYWMFTFSIWVKTNVCRTV